HLRDLKQSNKETFRTGTAAAAAGGVTSLIDMPNNIPPTNTLNALKNKFTTCMKDMLVNVGFYSGLPENIEEIGEIVKAGVFGFKIYLNNPPAEIKILDKQVLKNIARKIAASKSRLLFHAEIINEEATSPPASTSLADTQIADFLKTHDSAAEIKAVKYILDAIRGLELKVHLCHITLSDSIEIIKNSSHRNFYSIEVTPHHLLLDSDRIYKMGSIAKTLPPLRSRSQVNALWKTAIDYENADIIASDHAPHEIMEKNVDFKDAPAGIPGLETTIPLLFTEVLEGRLALNKLLKLICYNPAEIMNINRRGRIREGYFADIVLLDCEKESRIKPDFFLTKAKYSPFEGFKIKCRVDKTIVNGKIVYEADTGVIDNESAVILKPATI
ncbi:MAG: dihydroorotase family protein, partial [Candidatus Odinarchaeota archaeon]